MSRDDDEQLDAECDLAVRRINDLLNASPDITLEGFTRGMIVATASILFIIESRTDPSCPGCAESSRKYAMSAFAAAIRSGSEARKKKSDEN